MNRLRLGSVDEGIREHEISSGVAVHVADGQGPSGHVLRRRRDERDLRAGYAVEDLIDQAKLDALEQFRDEHEIVERVAVQIRDVDGSHARVVGRGAGDAQIGLRGQLPLHAHARTEEQRKAG